MRHFYEVREKKKGGLERILLRRFYQVRERKKFGYSVLEIKFTFGCGVEDWGSLPRPHILLVKEC